MMHESVKYWNVPARLTEFSSSDEAYEDVCYYHEALYPLRSWDK